MAMLEVLIPREEKSCSLHLTNVDSGADDSPDARGEWQDCTARGHRCPDGEEHLG